MNYMHLKHFLLLSFVALAGFIHAQAEVIYLENPSFEDVPRAGYPPSGWMDCGFPGESPPDVQPFGGFGVTQTAYDKETYVGLVVRDNKTWEAVSQKLAKPMKKGQCYKFSIYLSRSERYVSPTKKEPNQLTNFERGACLRIFGGNGYKDKAELLAASDVVEHAVWREYKFEFTPKNNDYNYFILEAYYKTPTMFHYNGNILIDDASDITPCVMPEPMADNLNVNKKPDNKNDQPVKDGKNLDVKNDQKEENRGVFDPEIKTNELKVGYTFQLENLYFQADSTTISKNAERVLYKLLNFMKNNPTVSIEIGGHTNNLPAHEYCDRLSSDRAKNVSKFLIDNGISKKRISYKGYGKRKPIADNNTEIGKQRNQRVEIKITALD
jgi:outer membrane protein OmpA-like peptidoglycan-associated protein